MPTRFFNGMITKFANDVFHIDLFVSVCKTLGECKKDVLSKMKGEDFDLHADTAAFYVVDGSSNFSIGLIEKQGILGNLCHEASHITQAIFGRIGMNHSIETDEAYSYLLQWVFECGLKALGKSGYSFYGI